MPYSPKCIDFASILLSNIYLDDPVSLKLLKILRFIVTFWVKIGFLPLSSAYFPPPNFSLNPSWGF